MCSAIAPSFQLRNPYLSPWGFPPSIVMTDSERSTARRIVSDPDIQVKKKSMNTSNTLRMENQNSPSPRNRTPNTLSARAEARKIAHHTPGLMVSFQ